MLVAQAILVEGTPTVLKSSKITSDLIKNDY